MKKNLLLIVLSLLFFGLHAQEDCGCEILPEDIPVCVEIEQGIVLPLPNDCFAECWGFGPDSYVDCGEIDPFPQDSTWVDCDCEINPEEEFICVLTDVELNTICQFPNLCFAECLGYTEADVVACNDTDWPEPSPCDCEIDPEAEWICIEIEEGFSVPYPSLCFAECDGFTEADVVACDDVDWPEPSPCDCEIDLEAEWICVEVEDGFVMPFPNLCFAECEGYTEENVVACDDNDWPEPSPCDCDIDQEVEWICIEVEDGFAMPFPNLCFAECEGYTEADVIACDDLDWPQDSTWTDPCDCEFDPEAEWICIEVEGGFTMPFPNLCFAECEGFTTDDVVECDDLEWPQDSTWTDPCDCEILPTDEPVCVEVDGELCELPNQCLADCFGLETVDCDGYTGGVIGAAANEQYNPIVEGGSVVRPQGKLEIKSVFPNPVTGNEISVEILFENRDNSGAEIKIADIYGNIVTASTLVLEKGSNKLNINLGKLNTGIYFVNVISEGKVSTQRIIKQ